MCACEGKKEKGRRLLLRLSISRDQLMAADDGAERGQGSKPCIVSLALLSRGVPSLSLGPLLHPSPAASCTFTYIYQHCASPGREDAPHALLAGYPCSLRRCSSCVPRKAISASTLYCAQALVHDAYVHLHEMCM